MNVTVFGGSGFLGSHVADVLSKQGHKVVIFDRSESPYLLENQKMIIGDILDERMVAQAISGADIVYNFVALADIEDAAYRPRDTIQVNVMGNLNILEAIKNTKIKKFIFASSVYVYSDSGLFYRSSKQACELFIENYAKAYGLKYTILRYGSLYGPRSNDKNWIYRMLKQALSENKIIRAGDGEELREYIHVLDAARLSVDILAEDYDNRSIIITGAEQIKIKDLLVMVREIFKNRIKIEYVPAQSKEHYEVTPYVFKPQMASKIRGNEYVDLGQGIIEMLSEMHTEIHSTPKRDQRSSEMLNSSIDA